MPIIGKTVVDLGTDWRGGRLFADNPYPSEDPRVAKIDESKTYGDFTRGKDELTGFLNLERELYFKSKLFLPFFQSEYILSFFVSHHSWSWGIKDFKVTFMVRSKMFSDKEKAITKEYQMEKRSSEHYFWQQFPVELAHVVSCKIEIISTWNGDLSKNHLNGLILECDPKRSDECRLFSFDPSSPRMAESSRKAAEACFCEFGEILCDLANKYYHDSELVLAIFSYYRFFYESKYFQEDYTTIDMEKLSKSKLKYKFIFYHIIQNNYLNWCKTHTSTAALCELLPLFNAFLNIPSMGHCHNPTAPDIIRTIVALELPINDPTS
ncbi:Butanol dehydrogenase-like protein, partial [Aduncisulcus paluster]